MRACRGTEKHLVRGPFRPRTGGPPHVQHTYDTYAVRTDGGELCRLPVKDEPARRRYEKLVDQPETHPRWSRRHTRGSGSWKAGRRNMAETGRKPFPGHAEPDGHENRETPDARHVYQA